MKLNLLSRAVIGALICGAATSLADAATCSNGTATATFTVQANCTISANPLSVGTNGVLTSAINQQTTVAVDCTNTTPYNVGLDGGTVTGSSVANRLLGGTASDNTGGTTAVTGVGTGGTASYTMYGVVPVQSTPQPGNYSDSITAAISF